MKKTIASLLPLTVIVFALHACGDSESGGYAPPPEQMPVMQNAPQPQDLGSALPGQAAQPAENPPADAAPPVEPPADGPPQMVQPPTPPVMLSERSSASAAASALPQNCSTQRMPGAYISITAPGRMNGTTFTATSGAAVWQRTRYAAASTGGKTKQKASPIAPDSHTFVYSGSYTIKRSGTVDTTGCVMLTTAPNAASLSAQPRFIKPAHGTTVASGAVTKLTVTRLSATGGSGSFQLSNGLTGTIKLTSRQRVP